MAAAELGVSLIVALAKAGYEACMAVEENKKQVARIAERLSWVIRRTEDGTISAIPDQRTEMTLLKDCARRWNM